MTNKERFMQYAEQRLREKKYKRRKFIMDLAEVQEASVKRCSKGKWKKGQK